MSDMRTPLVAGNWKMNLSAAEGAALVEQFLREVNLRPDREVLICPPYLAVPKLVDVCSRTMVKVGAQDVFWAEKGAFTGNVSAGMLTDAGVTYCLVGHSETRGRFGKLEVPESTVGYFAETDETCNLKIKALLPFGIAPVLCVGEAIGERKAGQTDEVIKSQLRGALDGIEGAELASLVVAYEPVWAIGTGEVCGADEAERVCGMIRGYLGELFDTDTAERVRVLYGGSVKPDNAKELFSQPNIDGGLVGGASLDAKGFASIVLSV